MPQVSDSECADPQCRSTDPRVVDFDSAEIPAHVKRALDTIGGSRFTRCTYCGSVSSGRYLVGRDISDTMVWLDEPITKSTRIR